MRLAAHLSALPPWLRRKDPFPTVALYARVQKLRGFLYCDRGMQLQMEEKPDYLVARFIGSGVAEEAWPQFELIAENCKRTKNDKLLIDATRAEVKVSLVERFLTAKRTVIFAQYGLKVAVVEIPERIDSQRFGELVAQNRGVNIRVFSDYQAAVNWLLD